MTCLNRSELSLVTRLILLVSVVGIRTNSGERRVSERVCVQEKNRRRACALKYQRMTHQCLTRVHLPISLSGLSKNCRCVFFTICTLNIIFLWLITSKTLEHCSVHLNLEIAIIVFLGFVFCSISNVALKCTQAHKLFVRVCLCVCVCVCVRMLKRLGVFSLCFCTFKNLILIPNVMGC